jgi:outer membrane receptor protein involved in Fe transport
MKIGALSIEKTTQMFMVRFCPSRLLSFCLHGLVAGILVGGLFVGGQRVQAQGQEGPTGALSGEIVDTESGDPLEGATVALWRETSSDSTLVTGTVTGADGQFTFEDVPVEAYTLRISYVGYNDRRFANTRPRQSEEAADLGTIRLSRETEQAGEVEVTADRPAAQIETDRTVYNTSERAVTTGGSARNVLETVPSVQIDTDGSISYRGNESVALHINGEPASLQGESLVSYLQSLPADAVQRVEIIPNPSARYEPEGMAGIINIILERNVNAGWGGGFTASGRADANGQYGGNGSVNAGYQSEGLRFVTTYSYRRGGEEDTDQRFVEQFNDGGNPNTLVDQTGSEEEQERSHSVTSRFNYSFTELTSLNFEGTFSVRRDESEGRNLERRYLGSLDFAPDSTNARVIEENSSEETVDGRLAFEHAFTEDEHTLEAQLRYDRDFETEDNSYSNYVLLTGGDLGARRGTESDLVNEDEQEGAFELDYVRPVGLLDLETGYKGTLRRLDSDQTLEGDRTDFIFDERIHAAYGILSDDWGDFGGEVGLRAEAVNTDFDITGQEEVSNDYVSFYPSAFLTYEPNERRQARLSYSKRVDRPSLWDINPIEDNENPTFRNQGNPNLDPEYIHSFELSATQRWGTASMTVTPYVRHTVNEIEDIEQDTTINGEKVILRRAENLSSSTSYGTELVSTFNWNERLEGTLSGNVYRSVTDGSNLSTDLSNDALTYSLRGNIRGEIRDGLQLELSQFYRPATDIPGGRIDRFTSTEVALQQQLFGGDGTLTLRVEDLFNANQFNVWRRTDNFYQESSFQWGAREYSITFQYTFGNNPEEREGREGGGGFEGGEGPPEGR